MKKLLPLALLLAAGSAGAQSHLDKVLQQKTLEVCTTGDYKPYTFLKEDGSYEGIDIDMAESLAKSLGAKVKWVKTSWKTLTPDFTSGKCDIAMGGISVTLERQKQVFFADKLDTDGKIPLVRCTDVKNTALSSRSTNRRCVCWNRRAAPMKPSCTPICQRPN